MKCSINILLLGIKRLFSELVRGLSSFLHTEIPNTIYFNRIEHIGSNRTTVLLWILLLCECDSILHIINTFRLKRIIREFIVKNREKLKHLAYTLLRFLAKRLYLTERVVVLVERCNRLVDILVFKEFHTFVCEVEHLRSILLRKSATELKNLAHVRRFLFVFARRESNSSENSCTKNK